MLSRSATYAVSSLTFLATQNANGWTLSREISEALSIPPQYLARILGVLSARRILESQRGRKGGFRLARPPSEITLMDIVDPFDYVKSQRLCFFGMWECSLESPCPIHRKWKPVWDGFVSLLEGTTLAELVELLGPEPFGPPALRKSERWV
jgi:Rrf2 family protein